MLMLMLILGISMSLSSHPVYSGSFLSPRSELRIGNRSCALILCFGVLLVGEGISCNLRSQYSALVVQSFTSPLLLRLGVGR
jgi:hypothetical protein